MLYNKFSFLVPVYNNGPYLKHCLNAIKDVAHQIVILEGGWNVRLPKRSTDNTLEVIDHFVTTYHSPQKVKVIQYDSIEGEDRQTQTYNPNVLFNQLRAKKEAVKHLDGDWMMMVDSDEIYKYEDLIKLDRWLDDFRQVEEFFVLRIPAFVFYFSHWFGTQEHFTRISRILEQPPELEWEDQVLPPKNMELNRLDVPPEICQMYHYGYPTLERASQKMNMWDGQTGSKWLEEFKQHILTGDLKEGQNYHLFAQKLGYGQKFEKFEGQHPRSILNALEEGEL